MSQSQRAQTDLFGDSKILSERQKQWMTKTKRKYSREYSRKYMMPFMCFSVISLSMSSMPEFYNYQIFIWTEAFTGGIIAMEICIRLLGMMVLSRYRQRNATNSVWWWMMILDVMCLTPILLSLVTPTLAQNKTVLGWKCFRMLKALRGHKDVASLLLRAVGDAWPATMAAFFFLIMVGTVSAAIMFVVEDGAEHGYFHTLPNALWFVVVTMSTVGYGSVIPETSLGRCFACVIIGFGVVFLAMPLAVIGESFNTCWKNRDMLYLSLRCQQEFCNNHSFTQDTTQMSFDFFDSNRDGFISFEEFVQGVLALEMDMSKHRVWLLWLTFVEQSDQTWIDVHAFASALLGEGHESMRDLIGGHHSISKNEILELEALANKDATSDIVFLLHKLKRQSLNNNVDRECLRETFGLFDVDGSGTISFSEMVYGIQMLGIQLPFGDLNQMWKEMDNNGDNQVDLEEFYGFFDRFMGPDLSPDSDTPSHSPHQPPDTTSAPAPAASLEPSLPSSTTPAVRSATAAVARYTTNPPPPAAKRLGDNDVITIRREVAELRDQLMKGMSMMAETQRMVRQLASAQGVNLKNGMGPQPGQPTRTGRSTNKRQNQVPPAQGQRQPLHQGQLGQGQRQPSSQGQGFSQGVATSPTHVTSSTTLRVVQF